ncbi:hypothetical protein BXY64_2367 [Marinifilum flexuosum]|uniref:Uncharacterized protein n=1 Tax=Marinifilum flexuosum TaxID=1117708 RepID=A0A419X3U5_9BACT|nr:hypothetical protein BXY64_2367 [Marinifilum flexuosum]
MDSRKNRFSSTYINISLYIMIAKCKLAKNLNNRKRNNPTYHAKI